MHQLEQRHTAAETLTHVAKAKGFQHGKAGTELQHSEAGAKVLEKHLHVGLFVPKRFDRI